MKNIIKNSYKTPAENSFPTRQKQPGHFHVRAVLRSDDMTKSRDGRFSEKQKGSSLQAGASFLVRMTGLEPVRHGHTPLKRACLPVPAHPQISVTRILYSACSYLSIPFFGPAAKKAAGPKKILIRSSRIWGTRRCRAAAAGPAPPQAGPPGRSRRTTPRRCEARPRPASPLR